MSKKTTAGRREAALAAIRPFLKQVEGLRNRDNDRLIIDRRFWARGDAGQDFLGAMALNGGNMLLKRDSVTGKVGMCCLGFASIQSGAPLSCVLDNGTPEAVLHDTKRAPRGILKHLVTKLEYSQGYGDNDLASRLMQVNDAQVGGKLNLKGVKLSGGLPKKLRSETHREELVARLFATVGVKVKFVN